MVFEGAKLARRLLSVGSLGCNVGVDGGAFLSSFDKSHTDVSTLTLHHYLDSSSFTFPFSSIELKLFG